YRALYLASPKFGRLAVPSNEGANVSLSTTPESHQRRRLHIARTGDGQGFAWRFLAATVAPFGHRRHCQLRDHDRRQALYGNCPTNAEAPKGKLQRFAIGRGRPLGAN